MRAGLGMPGDSNGTIAGTDACFASPHLAPLLFRYMGQNPARPSAERGICLLPHAGSGRLPVRLLSR
jgi:hypothetical protein